jgi:hypothetical protein
LYIRALSDPAHAHPKEAGSQFNAVEDYTVEISASKS